MSEYLSDKVSDRMLEYTVDGGNPAPVNRWFIPL